MSEVLTIVHEPHGLDSPYDTLFEERRPRDPIGGDMVVVGFLTRPGRTAEAVRLHWLRNGRPQTSILARPAATGADEDRWLVELGVLEGGDHVEYWITAEGANLRAESPRYRFGVRRWHRLAGITRVRLDAGATHLTTIGEDGRPGPALVIADPRAARLLRLRVESAAAANAPAPSEPPPPSSAPEGLRGLSPDLQLRAAPATNDPLPETVEIPAPGLTLAVETNTGRFTLLPNTPTIDPSEPQRLPHPLLGPLTLRWLEAADGALVAVELLAPLADGEALVGFGERFDALDQRGRAPDVAVYEQYKNQGNRTYLPVPFFLSSRGYGCLIEGTAHVAYDLGRTAHDRWRCVAQAPGGSVALDLFAGSPAEILGAFTELVGRPVLPPPLAFGPWMSSNEWNSQARVEAEVAQTRAHGIPATVLVLEAWSDETTFYVWNGARYAPTDGAAPLRLRDFAIPPDGPWPDPKGLIDALHAAGIRLLLWQIPALKDAAAPHPQHDADVAHALERGYVLRDAAGAPYRNPAFWFRNALIPDFTDPAATAWWLGKRAYLLDELGVDGFKTDGGEHLQGRDLRAHDGRRGDELVNAYPNLYVGAYHRFARERRNGDALTFSRAGHTGAGAFPAHWAGDENSTWEAFRRSLVSGLTAGLSGVPFWGWDLAGFSVDLPSAELYLRATAMAAFCPIMQYHSEHNPAGPSRDRTPWNVARHTGDPRVIPLARFFARLRMNLLPYVVNEAAHCAATGEPLLRPLLLDHPDDTHAWRIQDQYRFGRDLLVAPVLDEGTATRRLYLPPGTWHDLWTGAPRPGGRWVDVPAPLEAIPAYVRAGAVLPLNLGEGGALGDDVGNAVDRYARLTFWLYPTDRTEYHWVDVAGTSRRLLVERRGNGGVRVTLPPLPVGCALVVPAGPSTRAAPCDRERQVVLV